MRGIARYSAHTHAQVLLHAKPYCNHTTTYYPRFCSLSCILTETTNLSISPAPKSKRVFLLTFKNAASFFSNFRYLRLPQLRHYCARCRYFARLHHMMMSPLLFSRHSSFKRPFISLFLLPSM